MNISPEAVRVQDGIGQTRALELTHPQYENTVSIIGTTHYAPRQYYADLNTYIDGYDQNGACVHYEALRYNQTTDAKVRALLETLTAGTIVGRVAARLGFVGQLKGISYKPHWENHDMSAQDLYDAFIESDAEPLPLPLVKTASVASRVLPRRALHWFLMGSMGATEESSEEMGRQFQKEKDLCIDRRNAIALSALRAQVTHQPQRDVVLIWGAGHEPGLVEGTQQMGFIPTAEHWFDVAPIKYRRSRRIN